ncbi:MAG: hypothetical protein QXQ36_07185 [Sulfolobales archaeon]
MVAPLAVVIGAVLGIVAFITETNPVRRMIDYTFNRWMPNKELEPGSLIDLYLRGVIDYKTLEDRLKAHGYDPGKAREFLELSKTLFTVEQAIYSYRRGIISDSELRQIFKANGIPESEIPKYLKMTEYFPPPSDLIRFAVREVFTPEIVEKYRMHEDLPEEFLRLAGQVGIPEQVARWYWYAHWDLPSLTMGFEMFRRKIISEDELKTLMRTLDIMPGWRDKLLQLAYELPTRVDLRRMYELGVITRDQLKEYYEKLGYTPQDAELLTRWTEIEYSSEDRNLTVKQILELYELGEFTREQAIEHLVKMGYPQESAELKVTLYEHERLLKEAKEELQLLLEQYKNGIITYEELIDQAFKLPFSPTTIQRHILKAYRERQARVRIPSMQTLKRWLKLNIISTDQFREYLKRMNYSDEDIENFIKEINLLTIDQIGGGGD